MRIVWIGFHEEGVPAFRRLLEKGVEIAAFLTLKRERLCLKSAYSTEYEKLCKAYGVAIYQISSIKGEEACHLLDSLRPDLLIVLGWSEILPKRLLRIPSIGTVGTHASLLPHNRGSAPVNWAIIRGETRGGNTLMWLSEEVDAGEIISQMEFPITMYDTCRSVYEKVARTNESMLVRLLERLAGEEKIRRGTGGEEGWMHGAQDEPLLPRRRPQDGVIDWDKTAKQIYDFIRALTRPYPGAFTYLGHEKIWIWSCALLAGSETGKPPGTILGNVYSPDPAGCGIAVAAKQGILILHEIEDSGGICSGKRLHEAVWEGRFENAQGVGCGGAPG